MKHLGIAYLLFFTEPMKVLALVLGSDATYLARVVKDSLKFAENHYEAIHRQIRRA